MSKIVWKADKPVRVYELARLLNLSSPTTLTWLFYYGITGKRSASSKVTLGEAFYFLDCMSK